MIGAVSPVSLIAHLTDHCVVTDGVLELAHYEALVAAADRGATVGFAGIVRDHDHGKAVSTLEYVGHPTADRHLRSTVQAVSRDYPQCAIVAAHRIGPLLIGDIALVVAVASAHRAEAFAACAATVDRIKADVPIWKRQTFTDGSTEWVACGSTATPPQPSA